MYENGGNTTHRLLDGHPRAVRLPLRVAARHPARQRPPVVDVFPVKYRWPVFALDATPEEDYRAIIDEECKVRARTPQVSKFRHVPFDFSDDERCAAYVATSRRPAARAADNVAAFFRATFDAWKDYRAHRPRSRSTSATARSSSSTPTRSSTTCPRRTSCTSCAIRGRPTPTPRSGRSRCRSPHYMLGWTLNQYYALALPASCSRAASTSCAIEDVMADPLAALRRRLRALGVEPAETLRDAELERRAARGGLPVGHHPHGHAGGEPAPRPRSCRTRSARRSGACAWQYLETFDYASFV